MQTTTLRLVFALLLLWCHAGIFAQKQPITTPKPIPAATLEGGDWVTLSSPDRALQIRIGLAKGGVPQYSATWYGKKIIGTSRLGIVCRDGDFSQNMRWVSHRSSSHDETWKTVWGEEDQIRDEHNELIYTIQTPTGRQLDIRCRAFNNGFGFRYELSGTGIVTVTDEVTEFTMTGDHTTWWNPCDWDSNEHTYSVNKMSEIDALKYQKEIEPFNQHIPDRYAVQTPVTMKTADGTHIAIAEAALVDYGAMQLSLDRTQKRYRAMIVPTADSTVKSVNQLPFHTPWRVVMLSRDAAGILRNRIVLNLNEPCKLEGDLSWIKPRKYMGIWWEMFVGRGSWNYYDKPFSAKIPNKTHAANTTNVKKYIDFAAQNGIPGLLVEGWNEGWEEWFNVNREEVFNFTKPYPDYDMPEISRYAKQKGVGIVVHHETSAAIPSYERQMDAAFQYVKDNGFDAIKSGYVGYVLPKGEWHDGQYMVRHYQRVLERSAQKKIMVCAHEPVRPSGLHRTWPNFMACEAGRGMEYNSFSKGNDPSHELTLIFTRLLGGPMDYTPGVIQTRLNLYDTTKKEIVHTTTAKQLALYVTLYSPIQMAADLPEHYAARPDVFQFIKDVPTDWSETRILHAAVGDYVTTARRERNTANWYIGSMTDEQPRRFKAVLDFLESGKSYEATIYADGKDAHWITNPAPVEITKRMVKKGDTILLNLQPGGGCAISIKAI